jgi:hypothetical protein
MAVLAATSCRRFFDPVLVQRAASERCHALIGNSPDSPGVPDPSAVNLYLAHAVSGVLLRAQRQSMASGSPSF